MGILFERIKLVGSKGERDIIALFDGFTTNTVGTTNTDLTIATFREALYKLEKSQAPRPYYAVISPAMWKDLAADIQAVSGTAPELGNKIREQITNSYWVYNLFGVPIYVSTLFSDDASGDHKGAMFSSYALGIAWKWRFKVETERDVSLRGTEFVGTAAYGVGELVDKYGVEILADGDA